MTAPRAQPPRRLLESIPWGLPALVMVWAGCSKWWSQDAVPPAWVARFTDDYPTWLWVLGVAEVTIAAALIWSRTRTGARWVAGAALVAFSTTLAGHADQQEFLASCGCLGGLPAAAADGATLLWIALARNALLLGCLVAAGRPGESWRVQLQLSAASAAISFAIFATSAEWVVAASAEAKQAALREGVARAELPRWEWPRIVLRGPHGPAVPARDVFQADDVLVCVGPNCPACCERAPSILAHAAALRERGRRLLLIVVGTTADSARFQGRCGLTDLPAYTIDEMAARQLAITEVPLTMVLDDDGWVVWHPRRRAEEGAAVVERDERSDAATGETRIPEFDRGELARQLWPAAANVASDVPAPDWQLVKSSSNRGPVELALISAVDAGGVLRAARVVDPDAFVAALDPAGEVVDRLLGLPVSEATTIALRLADQKTLEAPLWHALGSALDQLSEELRRRHQEVTDW